MESSRLPAFPHGPRLLTLVRHAESLGNLADAEARSQGSDRLDLDVRDADVELSDNGKAQADALGRWFSRIDAADRPALVITSPYRRAADTATRTVGTTGVEVITDERLRERDLGLFDGFPPTASGCPVRDPFAATGVERVNSHDGYDVVGHGSAIGTIQRQRPGTRFPHKWPEDHIRSEGHWPRVFRSSTRSARDALAPAVTGCRPSAESA